MGKRLTVRAVETLGPGRHSDGGRTGLLLHVRQSGSRAWVQRVTIHGRRHDIGLGNFPAVSLAEARELALKNKSAVLGGEDPLANKRRAKAEAAKRLTFAEAAQRTCEELAPGWKGPKEAKAFLSSLKSYTFPYFGNTDIAEVTPADIRRAVINCRKRVPNLAVKVQHRVLSVFKYAVAEGLRPDNPARAEALALPKMEKRTTNNRALPYAQLAAAIDTVKASNAWLATKLALEFTALTAARSGEVRGASWSEIDMASGVWAIPAERMKMGRKHRVPLSRPALDVLRQAEILHDTTDLVFPSATGRELSDSTMSKLLREQGINSTVHGFRASFRTWVQERTNVAHEVAEAALAHVKGNKTEAAYARSELFEKRRLLMDQWAIFLSETRGDVVSMTGKRRR